MSAFVHTDQAGKDAAAAAKQHILVKQVAGGMRRMVKLQGALIIFLICVGQRHRKHVAAGAAAFEMADVFSPVPCGSEVGQAMIHPAVLAAMRGGHVDGLGVQIPQLAKDVVNGSPATRHQLRGSAGENGGVGRRAVVLQDRHVSLLFRMNNRAGKDSDIFTGGPMENFQHSFERGVFCDGDDRGVFQMRLMQGNEFPGTEAGGNGIQQVLRGFVSAGKRFDGDPRGSEGFVRMNEDIIDKNEPANGSLDWRAAGDEVRNGVVIGGMGIHEIAKFKFPEIGKAPGLVAASRHGQRGEFLPGDLLHFGKPGGDGTVVPARSIKENGAGGGGRGGSVQDSRGHLMRVETVNRRTSNTCIRQRRNQELF